MSYLKNFNIGYKKENDFYLLTKDKIAIRIHKDNLKFQGNIEDTSTINVHIYSNENKNENDIYLAYPTFTRGGKDQTIFTFKKTISEGHVSLNQLFEFASAEDLP